MALARQDIEFKARDGTTLRGWFYPQRDKSPCVIMTHGVSVSAALPTADRRLLRSIEHD